MSPPLVEIQGNKELKNALSHFKLELFVFVVELMRRTVGTVKEAEAGRLNRQT